MATDECENVNLKKRWRLVEYWTTEITIKFEQRAIILSLTVLIDELKHLVLKIKRSSREED